MASLPTYYEILALPPSLRAEACLSAQTLRTAYRRALLRNHPDKATPRTSHTVESKAPSAAAGCYSIDQITTAFAVLSDPKARRAYDEGLKKRLGVGMGGGRREEWRTGLETVDLDELDGGDVEGDEDGYGDGAEGEGEAVWWRACRCGDERGFVVRESDLEDAAGKGVESEVCVGCRGCSLWLRVLFAIVEEGDEGVDGREGGS